MSTQATRTGALRLENLVKRYPNGFEAVKGIDLDIAPGEFVTLLGPSGCGKTTTLRMIAGFEDVTSGDITLDGSSLTGIVPNKRPLAMVFQAYALFPHMNVFDNVAFGVRLQKLPKDEVKRKVDAALEAMGLSDLAERAPHMLSGGQQQRVALARAMVVEPKVLLFDEPLSNLDAKLRGQMREEIRRIQQRMGTTAVFVTHDQDEAMTMSDKIVVMSQGRIEQVGTAPEVYRRPRNTFVADFLGMSNLLDVKVTKAASGYAECEVLGTTMEVPAASDVTSSSASKLLIRPEAVTLESVDSAGVDSSWFTGTVSESTYFGSRADYILEFGGTSVRASIENPHHVVPKGSQVAFRFDSRDSWVLPVS
jgi:iron(III) transport system ATP-binding protein